MLIRAGYEIAFDCPAPTPMILMLSVRPERRNDLVTPETIAVSPARSADGRRCRSHPDIREPGSVR